VEAVFLEYINQHILCGNVKINLTHPNTFAKENDAGCQYALHKSD